jgi:hypothetical protein
MRVVAGDVVRVVGCYEGRFRGEVGVVEGVYPEVVGRKVLVYFSNRYDLHNGNHVLPVNKPTNQYWWLCNDELEIAVPVKLYEYEEML